MKKFLVAFLLITGTAFAAQEVNYVEALDWKYGKCYDTKGSEIVAWRCDAPKPSKAAIDETITEYLESQSYWVKRFDSKMLLGSLYQELSTESAIKFAPYTGAIQSMMDWSNFSGIRLLVDGLASQGIVTEAEQLIIYGCFLEQGIDLTEWSE